MAEIVRRVDPQPPFPVIGFFHGTTEYGDDDNRWYYQHPESDDKMPELVFNASYPFKDENQPGYKGDLYDGAIIEKVGLKWEADEKAYYWVIVTRPC